MTFLLVDDDSSTSLLLEKKINALFKLNSVRASGVESATRILNNMKVDFIVSDYWMGDGTGIDLARNIQTNSLNKNTPMVIFSSDQDLDPNIIKSYVNQFILKPAYDELLSYIQNYFLL